MCLFILEYFARLLDFFSFFFMLLHVVFPSVCQLDHFLNCIYMYMQVIRLQILMLHVTLNMLNTSRFQVTLYWTPGRLLNHATCMHGHDGRRWPNGPLWRIVPVLLSEFNLEWVKGKCDKLNVYQHILYS